MTYDSYKYICSKRFKFSWFFLKLTKSKILRPKSRRNHGQWPWHNIRCTSTVALLSYVAALRCSAARCTLNTVSCYCSYIPIARWIASEHLIQWERTPQIAHCVNSSTYPRHITRFECKCLRNTGIKAQ